MAVYSMTGYASAQSGEGGPGGIAVELRSVNGRFLDLSLRLPDELRGLEPALREMLGGALRRGKVELRLSTAREAESSMPLVLPEAMQRLARLESMVQGWLPRAAPLSVNEALHWCRGASSSTPAPDATLLATVREAVTALRESRGREGARLVSVLRQRTAELRRLAAQAGPLLPGVVQRQQQRFLDRWQEALQAAGAAQSVNAEALQERALNEAASFAIRIDVAEELARLQSHLDEIERLLDAGGEVGKRLDFLIQELQREANTLGSKSAALELSAIAVEMKVAIEQLREQVQNIE